MRLCGCIIGTPFVLDVSGWRIESQGTVFDFPMKSLVPRQNSIVVPFAVDEGQDIFFVTAGGGQFNGMQISPVVNAFESSKEQEVDVVAANVPAAKRSVSVEQEVSVGGDVVDVRERVSDVGHTLRCFCWKMLLVIRRRSALVGLCG